VGAVSDKSRPEKPRPEQVLLVAQPTEGGVAVCVRDLASAAVSAGFAVTVACPRHGDLAPAVRAAGAAWVPLEMIRSPSPSDPVLVAKLRRLVCRADLVHLHSSKAGALGRLALALLPARRRPPCVFTPHGWSFKVGGPLAPAYRAFERRAAALADAVVAVSAEEAELGRLVLGSALDAPPRRRGSTGREPGRLRVIENGVDTERFRPEGPAAPRDEAPLLCHVGRLDARKGQDVAIAALARMRSRARLRLVGDGPARARLERLAAGCGVLDRVEFAGKVSAPELHYRCADVVVLPSLAEAAPLTVLEAMACGRPVVMSDVGGASALGDGGVVVPVGDAGALAGALDELLSDPRRCRELGAAARRRAVERYRLEDRLAEVLGLWRELLS
jgi:glycosyltransferase involved in cell wall biosynthesis